jgi:nucleoside-diphosphate-sugar epimerase
LADRLLADGHHVIGFAHYRGDMKLTRLKPHPRLEIVWGFCEHADTMAQIPHDGVDGLFHLAALIDVAWSLRLNPLYGDGGAYWAANVIGTRVVAEWCARHNVRMMFQSSSEVYGTPLIVPINERDAINPQSPYAWTKVIGENELGRACSRGGCDIVFARPFNTYGPRQSPRSVIAKICMHAAECRSDDHNERRFHATDNPLQLGNVETKRDWLHVSDTVDGLVKIMERGRRGETYNLGTGRSVTVREAAAMAGVTQIETGTGQNRGDAEVLILQADASKARATLGWEPKIALEDGLRSTVESYIHA